MNISTVYVCEQGAVIRKTNYRLIVEKSDQKLLEIPVRYIRRLLLFGNIQVTSQAMAMLMSNGVDVSFLTMQGRLKGKVISNLSKNIYVRVAQHQCWKNQQIRLCLAKKITDRKIESILNTIKHYHRNNNDLKVNEVKDRIVMLKAQLAVKEDINQVMGIEGVATAKYFKVFSQIIKQPFDFISRQRRPAPDPVNSLLSLGYTMITNEMAGVIESHSLDPYLGFLHGIKYGRPSLALDLIEEFRQPMIDIFTVRVLNKKMFKIEDFSISTDGGMFLKEEAFKKYLAAYQKLLQETSKYGITWQEMFKNRVKQLEKDMMVKTGLVEHI